MIDRMMREVDYFSQQVRGPNGALVEEQRRDWAKRYLLSAHREVSDMLDALPGWKEHRHDGPELAADRDALTEEGIDVINYVLATLGLWKITPEELQQVWEDKQRVLWQRRRQELLTPILPDEPIAMLDLDGVLADFRSGFREWAAREGGYSWASVPDPERDLRMDVDLGVEPALYRDLKLRFERQGGYAQLPIFDGAVELLQAVSSNGYRPVFLTSRPQELSRTYRDSLRWLLEVAGVPERAQFTLVLTRRKAEWLASSGGAVQLCVEDDPAQIGRLSAQGYPVLVPARGYNADTQSLSNVRRSHLRELANLVQSADGRLGYMTLLV